MRRGCLVGAIGLLCVICFDHSAIAQQRRVLRGRETALSELPVEAGRGRSFLSPDGKRFAYITRSIDEDGDWLKVVVSGRLDSYSFDKLVSGTPLFSADGEHFVIAGKDGASWHAIHDGHRGNSYARIWDDSIKMNAAGDRLAFVADREDGKSMVVVDDRAGAPHGAILDGSLTFSPDGKHIAYAARDGTREFIVLDDQPAVVFDGVGRPIFSSDGQHLAFVATRAGKSVAVVDGKEGPAFDAIHADSLRFAPDGIRPAYVATVGGKRQAIFDGRPVGDTYPWIFSDSIVFSADGRRMAFAARLQGMMTIVVDGKEEPAYRSIVPESIRFSPDGKRIAYIAERPGLDARSSMRAVVVDGVEGKPYRWIRGAPVFSTDSRRVAYIAQRPAPDNNGWICFLVLDGIEGNAYPWIRGQPTLSVDGSRAAFIAAAPDERFADADEMPWNPDSPTAGGRLVLDGRPQLQPLDFAQKQKSQEPIKIIGVEERLTAE